MEKKILKDYTDACELIWDSVRGSMLADATPDSEVVIKKQPVGFCPSCMDVSCDFLYDSAADCIYCSGCGEALGRGEKALYSGI